MSMKTIDTNVVEQLVQVPDILQNACGAGLAEAAAFLLESGCDVDDVTDTENTALMAAAEAGHADVVALLLEAWADVDAAGEYGETALIKAAAGGACRCGYAVVGSRGRCLRA